MTPTLAEPPVRDPQTGEVVECSQCGLRPGTRAVLDQYVCPACDLTEVPGQLSLFFLVVP